VTGRVPRGLTMHDLEQALRLTFKKTRRTEQGSVSIAFITARRMRELNKQWRHKDRSTDVLSFSPAASVTSPIRQWGDILVDPAYVNAEAKRRSIAFREEVLRVVVHGMLHLFGYDHATERDELKMFTLQERVIAEATGSV